MNLQPIRPALPVTTLISRCKRCAGHVRSDTGFADLHDTPYRAYYCDACAAVLSRATLPPLKAAT